MRRRMVVLLRYEMSKVALPGTRLASLVQDIEARLLSAVVGTRHPKVASLGYETSKISHFRVRVVQGWPFSGTRNRRLPSQAGNVEGWHLSGKVVSSQVRDVEG